MAQTPEDWIASPESLAIAFRYTHYAYAMLVEPNIGHSCLENVESIAALDIFKTGFLREVEDRAYLICLFLGSESPKPLKICVV
jgi:hypothetical protein